MFFCFVLLVFHSHTNVLLIDFWFCFVVFTPNREGTGGGGHCRGLFLISGECICCENRSRVSQLDFNVCQTQLLNGICTHEQKLKEIGRVGRKEIVLEKFDRFFRKRFPPFFFAHTLVTGPWRAARATILIVFLLSLTQILSSFAVAAFYTNPKFFVLIASSSLCRRTALLE